MATLTDRLGVIRVVAAFIAAGLSVQAIAQGVTIGSPKATLASLRQAASTAAFVASSTVEFEKHFTRSFLNTSRWFDDEDLIALASLYDWKALSESRSGSVTRILYQLRRRENVAARPGSAASVLSQATLRLEVTFDCNSPAQTRCLISGIEPSPTR